jgi:hypothetical protein
MIDLRTYLNRITSEHKTKPRFMSLLEARLSIFADLYGCVSKLDEAFDLDNAVGAQLDVIGEYAGVKRLLTFQSKFEPPLLTDEYYRVLIRAKIFLNHWDGAIKGIHDVWNNIFPDYELQVVDNQDMTMKVVVSRVRTVFEEELIQRGYITPKPMGVLVNYDSLLSWLVDVLLYVGGALAENAVKFELPAPKYGFSGAAPTPAPRVMGAIVCWRVKQTILN